MKTSTLTALKAIYDSDPARTRADRDALLRLFGLAETDAPVRIVDRVISFEDAARRLNRTTRTVHLLARRGVLRKARMPGGIRASGILASDLDAFLERMVAN